MSSDLKPNHSVVIHSVGISSTICIILLVMYLWKIDFFRPGGLEAWFQNGTGMEPFLICFFPVWCVASGAWFFHVFRRQSK